MRGFFSRVCDADKGAGDELSMKALWLRDGLSIHDANRLFATQWDASSASKDATGATGATAWMVSPKIIVIKDVVNTSAKKAVAFRLRLVAFGSKKNLAQRRGCGQNNRCEAI
jgi:hypothetical protein